MGNLLGSNTSNNIGYGYPSGYGSQCCDPVVDPISLLTVIGAIAGLSLFLRLSSFARFCCRKFRNSVYQNGKLAEISWYAYKKNANLLNCQNGKIPENKTERMKRALDKL